MQEFVHLRKRIIRENVVPRYPCHTRHEAEDYRRDCSKIHRDFSGEEPASLIWLSDRRRGNQVILSEIIDNSSNNRLNCVIRAEFGREPVDSPCDIHTTR